MNKVKILQYVSCMNRAGAETLLMNIYRNINREKYEFHFITHTKEKCDYDDEIIALGGKVIYLERPNRNNIKKYKNDLKKIIDKNGPYNAIHSHMQLMNGLILKTAYDIGIKNRISHAHLNGDYKKRSFFRNIYIKYSKYL
ncbi:TPA: glycosyltransferase family 1 protein, partial [Clostridium perfringens]